MGIDLLSNLQRVGVGNYSLVADTDLFGGFRVVATVAARNGIPSAQRKEGMHVFVVATGTTFKLGPDLLTWSSVGEMSLLVFGNDNIGTAADAVFLNPGGMSPSTASAAIRNDIFVSRSMALFNAAVIHNAGDAGNVGVTVTYHLMVGGSAFTLVSSVGTTAPANGGTAFGDPGISVGAGSLMAVRATKSGVLANAALRVVVACFFRIL